MKKVVSFIILFLSIYKGYCQTPVFQWAKDIRTDKESRGFSSVLDAVGNIYVTGIFNGLTDFDPGPGTYYVNSGAFSVFILKLDPLGNFLWVKNFAEGSTEYVNSITLDNNGNIHTTGNFSGICDFDPGPGIFNLTSGGNADIFVLKLDPNGNFIWARQIGGNNDELSFSISLDQNADVYITGRFASIVDFDPGAGVYSLTPLGYADIFVCKLNNTGDFVWAKHMGANFRRCAGLTLKADNSGNILIAGGFDGTVDFDPGPGIYQLTPFGATSDIFILKLNNSGNMIWAKQIGGTSSEDVSSITVDAFDNFFVTGDFFGTVDFDPGIAVFNLVSAGAEDIFISKFNADGNLLWAKQLGGGFYDKGNSVSLDNTGNVYTTGFFTLSGDFDPGPGIYNLSAITTNVFISKLDNLGNFMWAGQFAGPGSSLGYSINISNSSSIYTTGYFIGTTDFDPGTGVFEIVNGMSSFVNGFVNKLSQCNVPTFYALNINACSSYLLNGQSYTENGIYTQIIPNSAGCDSIITLNLTINRKFTSVNATICEGQTYYAGGANQTTAGVYKDTLQTSLGCDSIITTTLNVNPKPKPYLGPDLKLCTNSATSITPGIFNSYLWQDNSTNPNYMISNKGKYWVTVTDANNCSATDTLNVLSLDTIPKNFLPANQNLCYGNVLRIAVPNYFTYQWSTGSIGDFIDISTFGTYYLTVKDFNSCTGTDSITVRRKNCVYMAIPNAFTPDGNSLNDEFKPTINQAIKKFSFIVFNRYGQTIFETREYGKGWDGTFGGKKQPSGSYVYRIKYTNIFEVETVENGSILLIR